MLPEILGVVGEDGTVSWVPLTPITTFRDVAACVRDTGDPLPLLLETSPLGVRVVAGWERPLELLRLWSELKDQVIYSVSYRHKDDPVDLLASFSRSYSLEEEEDEDEDKEPINPWELYDLKDELKNLTTNHRPLRASSPVGVNNETPRSRMTSNAKPLSHSLDDSDELMAVSSDGEADSSYNSHTQRSRFPFREANWFPHFNRSFRRPAGGSSRNPSGQKGTQSRRTHFARGQSQTSSLPSKSQKGGAPPVSCPKENRPAVLESHPYDVQYRKQGMQIATENGGSQYQGNPKHKLHEHLIDYENYLQHLHRNRNLSPVISKKQKLRHSEYKNVSTKPHDLANLPNGTSTKPSNQSHKTQWNQRNIRHLLQEHFSSKIQNRHQKPAKDVRNGEQRIHRSAKDFHSEEHKWDRSPQYGGPHPHQVTRSGEKENLSQHQNGFSQDKSFFGYLPGDQRQSQPPEYSLGPKRHNRVRRTDANGTTNISSPFDKSFFQHNGMPKTNGSLTYHQMNGNRGSRSYSSPLSKYLSPFLNGKGPHSPKRSPVSDGYFQNTRPRIPQDAAPLVSPTRAQYPEEGHPLTHQKGRGSPQSRESSKPRGGVDRPSRKSAASSSKQEVVHRRSYSDPLYEYLKEDFRALDYRKPTRRRRHSGGSGLGGDVVMRDTRAPLTLLPDGCELTVGELRDMANRQQQQIETQQQLLVAREQRLKYLKQQESRAAAVAAEADRLRRLRERVEAQEAKLRRLRALRGQVEATRLNTASLTTDLDAMRHLFSEKEKELVLAVSKVEELTRQLEELRQGRSPLNPNNQHHNELDKLRRELLYRNSVNREASARVDAQRETLAARRDEITRIDKRIAELQQRLHRKRILNHQLASQITAATQAKQAQLKAVQQKALRDGIHSENSADDINTSEHLKVPPSEDLGEFGPNKNDPKYQTLPYNTKFSMTFKTKNGQSGGESDSAPTTPTGIAPSIATFDATNTATTVPVNSAVVTRTVHSIPTHPPSRGLAHAPGALNQSQPLHISQQTSGPVKPPPNPAMTPRVYGPGAQQFNQRTQPLGSTSAGPNQKLNPGLTSHTQSRSLLPVHQSQESENIKGEGNEETASGTENGRVKPALPPKPAVPSKPLPPPRQKGDHLAASNESLNSAPPTSRVNQGRSQHGFRYASQNVIMSTYTQQTGTDPQSTEGVDDGAMLKVTNNIHNNVSNSKTESDAGEKVHVSINRRIEMPPDFMFPEDETPPSDLLGQKVEEIENGTSDTQATQQENGMDAVDNVSMQQSLPVTELEKLRINHSKEDIKMSQEENTLVNNGVHIPKDDSRKPDGADTNSVTIEEGRPESEGDRSNLSTSDIINNINDNINNNNSNNGGVIVRRIKKGNLKTKNSSRVPRRVSFDPLALLLDASLEGELELVRRTAMEVPNPSAANDEGITALHNAICAGHLDIVTFLVTFGCDVNAQDSDGWTPLHCAASCNNVSMVRFLVEHGACILATTLSDHETAAEKCEQDEEGYDGCSQYLYSVQEKLGIMNGGVVFGVYDYDGQVSDELSFRCGDAITILRRGDEYEREWWWGQLHDIQGYVPRNLLGLYPRVKNPLRDS